MAQKNQLMIAARDFGSRYGFEAIPCSEEYSIGGNCKEMVCIKCGKKYRPRSIKKMIDHYYDHK